MVDVVAVLMGGVGNGVDERELKRELKRERVNAGLGRERCVVLCV